MARVFVGLGSNKGERLAAISRAVQALAATPQVRVAQMAPVYETQPAGGPPQPDYLNSVVELETDLEPRALLDILKAIERRLGRVPSAERWIARPIDLDLLFYDDRVIRDADLVIPHERAAQRWFVLEPLAQIAADFIDPVSGLTVARLLEMVTDQAAARP